MRSDREPVNPKSPEHACQLKASPGGTAPNHGLSRIRHVRHPQGVRDRRSEDPTHQIPGPLSSGVGGGGALDLPTGYALEAVGAHQPFHGAAGHDDPFPVQL